MNRITLQKRDSETRTARTVYDTTHFRWTPSRSLARVKLFLQVKVKIRKTSIIARRRRQENPCCSRRPQNARAASDRAQRIRNVVLI